jgi:hypothetical protein
VRLDRPKVVRRFDQRDPARGQHPGQLGDGRADVGDMLDRGQADDQVERRRRERQALSRGEARVDAGRQHAGEVDRRIVDVDAAYRHVRKAPLQWRGLEPGRAADLEDAARRLPTK